jgi:hypothetical protein
VLLRIGVNGRLCENLIETSGSIKDGEFDLLSNCQLLKKDSLSLEIGMYFGRGEGGIMEPHFVFGFLGLLVSLNPISDT